MTSGLRNIFYAVSMMRRRSDQNTCFAFTQNLCLADGLVGLSLTTLMMRPTLTETESRTWIYFLSFRLWGHRWLINMFDLCWWPKSNSKVTWTNMLQPHFNHWNGLSEVNFLNLRHEKTFLINFSSIFALGTIAVERYFTITHPLRRTRALSAKKAWVVNIAIWIVSLSINSIPIFIRSRIISETSYSLNHIIWDLFFIWNFLKLEKVI